MGLEKVKWRESDAYRYNGKRVQNVRKWRHSLAHGFMLSLYRSYAVCVCVCEM